MSQSGVGTYATLRYGPKLVALDESRVRSKPPENVYDVVIGQTKVVNQMNSGRCWIFAGTNMLRMAMASVMGIPNMELSNSYLFYHDKLERSEYFLKKMTEPISKEEEKKWLKEPLQGDGGFFDYFRNLVEKYGIVPAYAMPETYCSTHSSELNEILLRVLRSYVPKMKEISIIQNEMEKQEKRKSLWDKTLFPLIRSILEKTLGSPPEYFELECQVDPSKKRKSKSEVDEEEEEEEEEEERKEKPAQKTNQTLNGLFFQLSVDIDMKKRQKSLFKKSVRRKYMGRHTPISFYHLIKDSVNLQDFVSLINDERHDMKTIIQVPLTNMISHDCVTCFNVPIDEMVRATQKSVCDFGIPVYIACDVQKQSDWKLGIMDSKLHNFGSLFGKMYDEIPAMSRKTLLETRGGGATHAMLVTGAYFGSDSKVDGWLIENSWGSSVNKIRNGHYHMDMNWWQDNVWDVVVPKQCVDPIYLSKQNKVIKVPFDDPFFD